MSKKLMKCSMRIGSGSLLFLATSVLAVVATLNVDVEDNGVNV